MRGLPPFSVFFLKINVVSFFVENLFFLTIIIILVSVVRLFIYYRGFHLSVGASRYSGIKILKFVFFFLVFLWW
jgi:NADH:ubiquinone oxidoreductase subunit 2 (subunit N)